MMRLTLLAASLLLPTALIAAGGAGDSGLFPVKHLRLTDGDGVSAGDYLIAQQRDPTAEVGLISTADGQRARLIVRLDTDSGVSIQRFEDLSSGWWAEWRLDFGYGNMGDADDFNSPMEWFRANRERVQRLNPPATYSLSTSDGPSIQWLEPRDEPEEAERARLDALARFAADLATSPPPESARATLSLAGTFVTGAEGHDSGARLVEALLAALDVAGRRSEATPAELMISDGAVRRSDPRFDLLQSFEPVGSDRESDPPE